MADEQDKPARRRRERAETTEREQPAGGQLEPEQGAKLAAEQATRTMEDIRAMGAEAGIAALEVGTPAAESDITSELSGGGVAFGEFVKSVGLAVAAAQAQLDKTLVDTAKALSDQRINTVAVFEQQINDETGLMDRGQVHTQELPLTNYLMPTAYQWSRVYLEADMNVQEFNSRSGFNIQQKSFSADARVSGNYGFGGFGVKGTAGMSYGTSSTSLDAAYGQDVAAGKLHMEATLEPRGDVELPRPFVLQKGPRLQVAVGGREDIMEGTGDTAKKVGHKVKVSATLLKTDNSPNGGKDLAINISEPTLNYRTIGDAVTDAGTGKVEWEIERRASTEELGTPVRAIARVSFGLVSGAAAVSL
jgi:hypothetical protein